MRYGVWAPIPQWVGGTVKWGDRYGTRPRAIVIHRMEGSLEGSDSYLRRERADYFPYPRLNASTHFGVGLWNGVPQIRQWVDTVYSAFGWSATPTDVPTPLARSVFADKLVGMQTFPYWRSTSDLNRDVIAIEVEGFHYQVWDTATTAKVKELIDVLVKAHGPLWIMAHTDCSTKPCPGMTTFNLALPGYYGRQFGGGVLPDTANPKPEDTLPMKYNAVRRKGWVEAGTELRTEPKASARVLSKLEKRARRFIDGAVPGNLYKGNKMWLTWWRERGGTDDPYDGQWVYVPRADVNLDPE